MKQNLLKWLYQRYKTTFEEFVVQDMIGSIPKEVHDEAITFLARGKNKLEAWIFFQSYHLQRRSVGDSSRAQVYHGMMIFLKVLLALCQESKIPKDAELSFDAPEEEDPTKDVQDFSSGIKNIIKNKSKK